MQQKRNHLAVLPKPCETLEARAGATFARTRKKVPLLGEPRMFFRWASDGTCAPFGAEPRIGGGIGQNQPCPLALRCRWFRGAEK